MNACKKILKFYNRNLNQFITIYIFNKQERNDYNEDNHQKNAIKK